MNLAFGSTATCRPEVFRRCLDSFKTNLQGVNLREHRLYLNVDPAPPAGEQRAVVEIAKLYFGEVIVRCPKAASFPAAVKRIYETAWEPLLFSLEDDWELIRPVHLDELRGCLNETVHQVCLRAYRKPYDRRYHWSLSPNIQTRQSYKAAAQVIHEGANPEHAVKWALWGKHGYEHPLGWDHSQTVAWPYEGNQVAIRDIGRDWLYQTEWRRGTSSNWTTWTPAYPLRYIVVGPPRSGTKFTAQVLSNLGLHCSHERCFTPERQILKRAFKLSGESSWLAAPHLDLLSEDCLVLHQVREPLATMDSIIHTKHFRGNKWNAYIVKHFPEVRTYQPLPEKASAFWLAWNSMIAEQRFKRPYLFYRVEDLQKRIPEILSILGVQRSAAEIQDAVDSARIQLGSLNRRGEPQKLCSHENIVGAEQVEEVWNAAAIQRL